MKINTKVVFEWNPKSKQYEEIYCDSYEHDGEVAECQGGYWGEDPLMGGKIGRQGGMFNQGGGMFPYGGGGGPQTVQQGAQPFNPYQSFGNLSGGGGYNSSKVSGEGNARYSSTVCSSVVGVASPLRLVPGTNISINPCMMAPAPPP